MKFLVAISLLLAWRMTSVNSALIVERETMMTPDGEFCIGEQLTFRCMLAVGSYDWILPPFLDGTDGRGQVPVGSNRTVGEFFLLASGDGPSRMSTLQVTVFQGLVGERTVTCRETGNSVNTQSVNITVLSPPSAPTISATGNTMFSSFNLTIGHPNTSEMCVQNYTLVVRQDGMVVFDSTFMRSSLQDDRFIDLMAIDNSLTVRTCQYTYTFELTPVGGSMSSGIQTGDPNFHAVMFSTDQYEIQSGEVRWIPENAFPNAHSCISGYQYSVNGGNITNVTSGNSFTLDSSFTDPDTCAMNVLTIQPIVTVGNSILNNVNLTGPTCDRELPTTMPMPTASISDDGDPAGLGTGPTAGIAVGAALAVGLLMGLIIGCCCSCCCSGVITCCGLCKRDNGRLLCCGLSSCTIVGICTCFACLAKHRGKEKQGDVEALQLSAQPQHKPVKDKDKATKPQEQASVYQDPDTIVRKTANETSTDMYTVPQKKGKKGGKRVEPAVQEEEEKKPEGLVYAEVDLKNAKKPPPSQNRPAPGPPGAIVSQDTGNVVYSTVQM